MKLQTPNSKLQGNFNSQAPRRPEDATKVVWASAQVFWQVLGLKSKLRWHRRHLRFGAWSFPGVWSLEFGVPCLP